MQNNSMIHRLLCLGAVLLTVGCASEPVSDTLAQQPEPIISGDSMLRESEGIAKLSDRWKNGKDMIERGTAMVNDGEAKIAEGKRMISEGNKIIQESEAGYKSIRR